MKETTSWLLEVFVEYDDSQRYLGSSPSAAPFEEFGGESIPMHQIEGLRRGADAEFVELLLSNSEGSGRGLPLGVSPDAEEAFASGSSLDAESVVGWLDGVHLQQALQTADVTVWGVRLHLLLAAVDFLAAELGPERVRVVFRAQLETV